MSERRAKSRLSARRKTEIVLRVLRGEDVDALSRELRIEAHRIARWPEEFLAAGSAALKDAQAKVGQLTMQVEILQEPFQNRGLPLLEPDGNAAPARARVPQRRRGPLLGVRRASAIARGTAVAAMRPEGGVA